MEEHNNDEIIFEVSEGAIVTLTELLQRAGYKSNKEFTDAIGVGPTALYNWKNGEPIKSNNLKRACKVLRVSFKTFLAAIGDTEDLDQIPDDTPPKLITKEIRTVAKAPESPTPPKVHARNQTRKQSHQKKPQKSLDNPKRLH